ncbi:MAG TPA: hypothetical protein VER33_10040, partial [Polyangiaceae bacterium]|nr:hypothetical protein [Polyangiaceae bacterium]
MEPELYALRQLAQELAQKSRERPSSVHLLAAVAAGSTPAAELLTERRLSSEELLRLGRTVAEELAEPTRAALQRAHDIAGRMGFSQASAAH